MSFQQPPVQVGGGAVLGSAGVKALAATGASAIKALVLVGVGMIGTGAAMVARGRGRKVEAGADLQD